MIGFVKKVGVGTMFHLELQALQNVHFSSRPTYRLVGGVENGMEMALHYAAPLNIPRLWSLNGQTPKYTV
jgi:hypothetical protein